MDIIEVRTQAELDAALKLADTFVVCVGGGCFTLYDQSTATLHCQSRATLYDQSTATLTGQSTATLHGQSRATLTGQSTATLHGQSRATLYDQSTATLTDQSTATLTGQSTATLTGQSTATLTDQSTATLTGQSRATGSKYTAIHVNGKARARGGHIIRIPVIRTPKQWCEFYGVSVSGGVATLFKAVNGDFTFPRGVNYAPGETPEAKDWDGGVAECGGGLHFSPRPSAALEFHPEARRFVACPVLLKDIVVHNPAEFPQKVKAKRVCRPCYEVDIDGKPVKP